MRFDEDNNTIWVRQSWLDDAMRCPERARLGVTKPDWDGPTDATTLGTGAHAAVEHALNDPDYTHEAAKEKLVLAIMAEVNHPNMRWNKYDDPDELIRRAWKCFLAWEKHILPIVPKPSTPEVEFHVPLYTLPDGRNVGIEGTIDLVPHNANVLWDWKFPGREYKQADKQKSAIQPTIYSLAAVKGGLQSVTDYEFRWPLDFVYGIGITQATTAKAQMFTVRRTEAHANWAIARIHTFVDLALNFGFDTAWPANDDHFLCSDKWCPWWSICKGAHMTWRDSTIPVDLKVA